MSSVAVRRDVDAVTIPDGKPTRLAKGTAVRLTQALGFSYTVQTERGEKLRIAGKDGDAIGEPVVGVVGDKSAPKDAEEVETVARKQLTGVYDPEIPVDIINLGLVHALKAAPKGKGFHVEVRMGLTSPGCGMGDVLVKDVEAALKTIPGVVSVDAQVVLFPVWNPHTMMSEAAKLKLGML
ncbi:MAG TPA: iron-sulfur cluster assembly protein [Candidatus Thermoplasmatota archaeon]|nr:iron-sulfur cluster assembly protein [Candidatus Thermoplasmatota archaeon]